MPTGIMGLITRKAPQFPEGATWLNVGSPLSLSKLAGSVVVLDFWTYCCINCMHMLPVLAKIEEKYKSLPVAVIGIHSAKYENEADPNNIREAISRYGIGHPVMVDGGMKLWRQYGISAWPTIVIISARGDVDYKIGGELTFEQLDGLVADSLAKSKEMGSLGSKPPAIRSKLIKPRAATLSYPGKLSFCADGSMFAISDSNHNRVLIIDSATGKILSRAGGAGIGMSDGSISQARFYRPQGVLWRGNSIYVADTENHAIRIIDVSEQTVHTLAGTGEKGFYIGYGSVHEAKEAALNSPWDIASDGKSLFIAMAGLHQIWRYGIDDELIEPFAGNGREDITDGELQEAEFAQPSGLWLQGQELYVADSETSSIRSVSIKDGYVGTLVGKGLFTFGDKSGSLPDTLLQHPLGLCASESTLYIADTYNSSIKAINLKKKESETVISGKGKKAMCKIDDPKCDTLGLFEPNDVKINENVLYIVDTNNHLIRTFSLKGMLLNTLKLNEGV
jgi:thiol-disulfide isomerase/thioredoxin